MPSPFGRVPVTKSLLDFQRVLSPNAGVRVSPLCPGAMDFGDAWSDMMGHCDKKISSEMLDYFYEQGGNFIDTLGLRIIHCSEWYTDNNSERRTITRPKNLRRGLASG